MSGHGFKRTRWVSHAVSPPNCVDILFRFAFLSACSIGYIGSWEVFVTVRLHMCRVFASVFFLVWIVDWRVFFLERGLERLCIHTVWFGHA